jgi:hypothetical protein
MDKKIKITVDGNDRGANVKSNNLSEIANELKDASNAIDKYTSAIRGLSDSHTRALKAIENIYKTPKILENNVYESMFGKNNTINIGKNEVIDKYFDFYEEYSKKIKKDFMDLHKSPKNIINETTIKNISNSLKLFDSIYNKYLKEQERMNVHIGYAKGKRIFGSEYFKPIGVKSDLKNIGLKSEIFKHIDVSKIGNVEEFSKKISEMSDDELSKYLEMLKKISEGEKRVMEHFDKISRKLEEGVGVHKNLIENESLVRDYFKDVAPFAQQMASKGMADKFIAQISPFAQQMAKEGEEKFFRERIAQNLYKSFGGVLENVSKFGGMIDTEKQIERMKRKDIGEYFFKGGFTSDVFDFFKNIKESSGRYGISGRYIGKIGKIGNVLQGLEEDYGLVTKFGKGFGSKVLRGGMIGKAALGVGRMAGMAVGAAAGPVGAVVSVIGTAIMEAINKYGEKFSGYFAAYKKLAETTFGLLIKPFADTLGMLLIPVFKIILMLLLPVIRNWNKALKTLKDMNIPMIMRPFIAPILAVAYTIFDILKTVSDGLGRIGDFLFGSKFVYADEDVAKVSEELMKKAKSGEISTVNGEYIVSDENYKEKTGILNSFDNLTTLVDKYNLFVDWIKNKYNEYMKSVIGIYNYIKEKIANILISIVEFLAWIKSKFVEFWAWIRSKFVEFLAWIRSKFVEFVSSGVEHIINAYYDIKKWLVELRAWLGIKIAEGIEYVSHLLLDIISAILKSVISYITDIVKGFFSVLQIIVNIGLLVVGAIASLFGFGDKVDEMSKSANEYFDGVYKLIDTVVGDIYNNIDTNINDIKSRISTMTSITIDYIKYTRDQTLYEIEVARSGMLNIVELAKNSTLEEIDTWKNTTISSIDTWKNTTIGIISTMAQGVLKISSITADNISTALSDLAAKAAKHRTPYDIGYDSGSWTWGDAVGHYDDGSYVDYGWLDVGGDWDDWEESGSRYQIGGEISDTGKYTLHGGELIIPRWRVVDALAKMSDDNVNSAVNINIDMTVNVDGSANNSSFDDLAEKIKEQLMDELRMRGVF